jgi:VanZ family protein
LKTRLKKYVIYQLPWQVLMLAIFVQSSMSQLELPDLGITWTDKIAHFIVFGLLGWLVARGLYHSQNNHLQKMFFKLTIFISLLYAAMDEIHQLLVPGRYADIYDFIADLLGVVVFAWLYKIWHKDRGSSININYDLPNNPNVIVKE